MILIKEEKVLRGVLNGHLFKLVGFFVDFHHFYGIFFFNESLAILQNHKVPHVFKSSTKVTGIILQFLL